LLPLCRGCLGLGWSPSAPFARRSKFARVQDLPSMAKEKAPESTPKPDNGPKRILLVDDDAEIIDAMRYALESKGYKIFIARDGNQGLAMAEREDPDLVILDMMMPKRSGFLVLEKLRRTRETPVRVIMITANEGSRHKAYAQMLGVDDYLRKPFAMDKLLDTVERLLA
jgi:DNA-binding response OmpR family regulator